VRNAKHGGTLVFVEPSEEVELARKDGPLRFKYRLAHTPARTRYQTLLARAITRLARLVHEKKLNAVSWDEYQRAPALELSSLDEALFEFAHFLADLMAVDGALVVTKRLQPVGFGAELRAEAPNLVEVRQALDAEATLWANEPMVRWARGTGPSTACARNIPTAWRSRSRKTRRCGSSKTSTAR